MKHALALFALLLFLPSAALAEAEAIPVDDFLPEEEAIVVENQPLVPGDANEAVTALQQKLYDLSYYTGKIDGVYGDTTAVAVLSFQADHGLTQTGDADAETQRLLFSVRYRPLRLGSMGRDVQLLQARLTELGYYDGKISGTYLPATQQAVYTFQLCSGETPTGLADEDTQTLLYTPDAIAFEEAQQTLPEATAAPTPEMLDEVPRTPSPTVPYEKKLKYESKGPLVKTLQQRLTDLGYYSGNISGNFLGHTRNAVKAFQEKNALTVDGVVGEATWNALFNDPDVRLPHDDPKPTPAPTPVPYAITVDVNNQVTMVYGLDENGEYTRLVRQMLCSTGKKATPSDVGEWVLSGRNARGCTFPQWGGHAFYWTKINDSIAFHSVLYADPYDSMSLKVNSYKSLGKRASHGCIRLTLNDAKWIYQNIGKGTVVTITEDLPADPERRAALKLPGLDTSCMRPIATPTPTAAPEYVSGAQPPQPFRTLKKNSKGEDVFWLQSKLQELGYYQGYVSGTYLDGTVKAVKAFQKDHGLSADGTAGEKTLLKIYEQELASPTPAPTSTPAATPTPAPIPTPPAPGNG